MSLKALSSDPWDGVQARYEVGKSVTGTVVKVAEFGVFVELEQGITALLPASESGVPREKSLSVRDYMWSLTVWTTPALESILVRTP